MIFHPSNRSRLPLLRFSLFSTIVPLRPVRTRLKVRAPDDTSIKQKRFRLEGLATLMTKSVHNGLRESQGFTSAHEVAASTFQSLMQEWLHFLKQRRLSCHFPRGFGVLLFQGECESPSRGSEGLTPDKAFRCSPRLFTGFTSKWTPLRFGPYGFEF